MVSTFPNRFRPRSHPDSHRIRVRFQSRPGKRPANSGVQISPVGRRLTKTAFKGCPAPIFARTMCSPLGVQKLPCCSPAPLREVETRYRFSTLPSSLRSVSVWSGMEISILGIAPRRKKLREQPARLHRENATRHRRVVIEFLFREKIDDAAAGAGLGIGRPEHETRD